jgi:hypothetical protein
LVKTAAASKAHGGKGGRICLLKPIIRAAQNFRWWIWEVMGILESDLKRSIRKDSTCGEDMEVGAGPKGFFARHLRA